MMRAASSLGDAALLLPAAFALIAGLAVMGRLGQALAWAAAFVLCGLGTVAAKLAFHACGGSLPELDVVSPSGHTSLATTFYGCLAVGVGLGRRARDGIALGCAAAALLAAIGISRVATGAHSGEEVVAGYAIGGACILLFRRIDARLDGRTLPPLPLAIGFALALAVLGGRHFSLESTIFGAARRLSARLDVCTPPNWRTHGRSEGTRRVRFEEIGLADRDGGKSDLRR